MTSVMPGAVTTAIASPRGFAEAARAAPNAELRRGPDLGQRSHTPKQDLPFGQDRRQEALLERVQGRDAEVGISARLPPHPTASLILSKDGGGDDDGHANDKRGDDHGHRGITVRDQLLFD